MRRRGKSIRHISSTLHASKSTVSYWCRNISLSSKQIQKLVLNKLEGAAVGRLRAAERKRSARLAAIQAEGELGAQAVGSLSQRDLFILGAGLYWGEGYKNGNEECGLTNSDPAIIRAFIQWLKEIHSVRMVDLILRVSINATHKHRDREIKRYWSLITTIPLAQFTKTSFIKISSRKIYKNSHIHFGTLRVKVRRGTALRRRILGSIGEIAKQLD
ncbi:MAG: hypothetical protein UY98_C0035G0004 [Candidatus Kaiserbacteria bacterium GW2011_GWA2_58_9]|uniref:Uncharacterized protein n=1 Tax=Candidatus Kaiserbacteria bacterium GW2011_GWA2_58_9 TaxID=1618672 RepID=A0A0G1YRK5_9BACT|nr:MAG: hypothetical protein UY98_C0035G0004 [Candidatus Kaiserbacteria bacterium GW2011_GWA2_58_9]